MAGALAAGRGRLAGRGRDRAGRADRDVRGLGRGHRRAGVPGGELAGHPGGRGVRPAAGAGARGAGPGAHRAAAGGRVQRAEAALGAGPGARRAGRGGGRAAAVRRRELLADLVPVSGGARTSPSRRWPPGRCCSARRPWPGTTDLLALFGIPAALLPEVVPTAGELAVTDPAVAGGRAVIRASLGDQQAALFGQRCWSAGMAKLTLGTGAFLWCHAGPVPPAAVPPGVVASCAWQTSRRALRTPSRASCRTPGVSSPGCAGSARCRRTGGRRSGTAPGAAATAIRRPGCGACPRCSGWARRTGAPRPGPISLAWGRAAPVPTWPRPRCSAWCTRWRTRSTRCAAGWTGRWR